MSRVSIVLEARASLPAQPLDISRHDITGNNTRILRDEHGNITFQSCSLSQSLQGPNQLLALIAIDGWRVSFEAKVGGFTILPPSAETLPAAHTVTVPASTSPHRVSTILRPGDCVRLYDDKHEPRFEFSLSIEDDVKVNSSLPRLHEESFEVPETQQRPDAAARRTQKKRTAIEVEQSMQGSSYLSPATPAQNTQQSAIVEETPATTRKMPVDTMDDAKDGPPHQTVDPRTITSTNISTPTAIRDSFAERHKEKRALQAMPPLRSFTSAGQTEDSEETTASETESGAGTDQAQDNVNADFSTATEGKKGKIEDTHRMLASTAHKSSTDSLQAMDVTADKTGSSSATEEGTDGEATPRAKPRRTLRAKPDPKPQPQVRIPPSRGTKRASPEVVVRDQPKKKRKKAKEVEEDELDDSLASTIKIRIDSDPTSAVPIPSSRRKEDTREEKTPAAPEGSQRSLNSSINVMSPYRGKAPRVAFSNTKVIEREGSSNFLRKSGVQTVDKVTEKTCDVVCIGANNGSYVKSAKLLLGLALGKTIVADTWVLNSRQAGKLLDLSQFPPLNAPNEWGWGDGEEQVNGVLSIDRSELFKGKAFFFTAALKKEYGSGFSDIEKIVKACGAKIMSKSAREYKHADNNIILAAEHKDLEAMTFMKAGKDEGEHLQCYSKDLISTSVLRGSLDLENDGFKIQTNNSQPKRGRRPAARNAK